MILLPLDHKIRENQLLLLTKVHELVHLAASLDLLLIGEMVNDTLLLRLQILKYPLFVRARTLGHLHSFDASHSLEMIIHLPLITIDAKNTEKLQL